MIGVTVSSGDAVLVVAVFIACAVEMVEALTIVFAVGHTRGWRSALYSSPGPASSPTSARPTSFASSIR
jgi:hypothetical protein